MDLQKTLLDFDSVLRSNPDITDDELFSQFPQFKEDENLYQSALDYSATLATGKKPEEINDKFPEFGDLGLKKKEDAISANGLESGSQLESQSPSDNPKPKLTYNDIEASLKKVKAAQDRIRNLENSPTASAGIGAKGITVSDADRTSANAELKKSIEERDSILKDYSKDISKPVDNLISRGEYKSFFENGVFQYDKARAHFDKVIGKYGGGTYLRETMLTDLKNRGEAEIDKPVFQTFLKEELAKQKIDMSKYGEDLYKKLSAKQNNNINNIKLTRDIELGKSLEVAKQKATDITSQFNAYVNGLNDQVNKKVITIDQAKTMFEEKKKEYDNNILSLNNSYSESVRTLNLSVTNRYKRIESELKKINGSITNDKVWESIPASDKKKIEAAQAAAGSRLNTKKGLAQIAKDDAAMGTGGSDVLKRLGSLFGKSYVSGLNSGLANLGDYLMMGGYDNAFSKWLSARKTQADETATAQYDYSDNAAKALTTSVANSLGASTPIMLPTIALGALSGGLTSGAIGNALISFYGENAQNAGSVFRDVLEKTGDINKADEKAEKVFKDNMITMPLYFASGFGDMLLMKSGGISKKLAGLGLEQVEELPTEYIQQWNEAKANGYTKPLASFVKENPSIGVDTFFATLGQGGIMSLAGKAFGKVTDNVPSNTSQFYADMINAKGIDFAKGVLDKYYQSGVITKEELAAQKIELEKVAQNITKLDDAGVTGDKSKLYISLSDQAQDLQNKIKSEKDPALAEIYNNQLNEIKSDVKGLIEGTTPYIVIGMAGNDQSTRVITAREFKLMDEAKANDLIQGANGVKVFNDETLSKEIVARKNSLGNTVTGVEGLYANENSNENNVVPIVDVQTKVMADIDKANKSLSASGIKIETASNSSDFVKRATELGYKVNENSQGAFLSDGKTVLINLEQIKDANQWDIVWHESSHPVMNIIRNTNIDLYSKMVNGLSELSKKDTNVAKIIDWAKGYEGNETQMDEAIVETIAKIANGSIDLSSIDGGVKQTIIDFVNSIAQYLKLSPILSDTDVVAFKKKALEISNALKTGTDISNVVGKENINRTENLIGTDVQEKKGDELEVKDKDYPQAEKVIRQNKKNISTMPEAVIPEVQTDKNGKPKITVVEGNNGERIVSPVYKNVPYNLLNGALKYVNKDKAKAVNILSDKIVKDYNENKDRPEINSAIGWYGNMRDWFQKNFGANIEIFGQLLAATSARTPVVENFKQALDAMKNLSAGKYTEILEDYDKHVTGINNMSDEDLKAKFKEQYPKKRDAEFNASDYRKFLVNQYEKVPLRSNGKKFNANSKKVLQALYGNWLEQTEGPKTKNFAGNLTGRSYAATIDVWAARYLRRIVYQDKVTKWRILPSSEGGVSYGTVKSGELTGDYPFAEEVMENAAEKLGIKADDLQAFLWYLEKDIYDKNKWSANLGVSFEEGANTLQTERYQAGVTTYKDADTFDAEKFEQTRKDLESTIANLNGVISSRVTASEGEFYSKEEGIYKEPTFDVEFTVEKGTNVDEIQKAVEKIHADFGQDAILFSKVVDGSQPNARPIIEIGLAQPAAQSSVIEDIKSMLAGMDVRGFTTAKDNRGKILGIRAQFVPEFEDGTTMQDGVKRFAIALDKIQEKYGNNSEISYIAHGAVDTQVKFKNDGEQQQQTETKSVNGNDDEGVKGVQGELQTDEQDRGQVPSIDSSIEGQGGEEGSDNQPDNGVDGESENGLLKDSQERKGDSPEEKPRGLSKSFDQRIPETVSRISQDAKTYFAVSNKQTTEEVNKYLEGKDPEDVIDYLLSGAQELPSRVRIWMSGAIMDKIDEQINIAQENGDDLTVGRLAEKQAQLLNQVAPLGTELGQAIQAFRRFYENASSSPAMLNYYINKIVNQVETEKGTKVTKQELEKITELATTVVNAEKGLPKDEATFEMSNYIGTIVPVKASDILMSIWYAHILSGVTTQSNNFFANFWNTFAEGFITGLRESVKARNPMPFLIGIKGFSEGIKQGAIEGKDILLTGITEQDGNKFKSKSLLEYFSWQQTKLGKLGNGKVGYILDNSFGLNPRVLRYVGRALGAVDAMYSRGNAEAISRVMAYSQALNESKSGSSADIKSRMSKILKNSNADMIEAEDKAMQEGYKKGSSKFKRRVYEHILQSRDSDLNRLADSYGSKVTLNYEPEGFFRPVYQAIIYVQSMKYASWSKVFVPFARIAVNLTENSLNYAGAGYWKAIRGTTGSEGQRRVLTNDERIDFALKATVGLSAFTVLSALTGDKDDDMFDITANGTGNPQKNYELQQSGWRPYSIKLKNGRYISYKDWPIMPVLAAIGAMHDHDKYIKEDEPTPAAKIALAGMASSIWDKSVLKGLQDMMSILSPNSTYGGFDSKVDKLESWAADQAKSIAVSNFTQQTIKMTQEYMDSPIKAAKGIDRIYRDIPFLNNHLNPIVNVFGEPVKPSTSERLLPITVAKPSSDQLLKFFNEYGAYVGKPKTLDIYIDEEGNTRPMTDKEYYDYTVMSGKITKRILLEDWADIIETINEMPTKKEKEKIAKEILGRVTSAARQEALEPYYE